MTLAPLSLADSSARAVDKIAAARVWLLKEKPFFGVLARAMTIVPRFDIAGVRLFPDDRLFVNPVLILKTPFPNLCARLAHVALHAALGGFPRRRDREPLRWNLAHDLAIDPLVRSADLPLTASPPPDDMPKNGSAEQIFLWLPEGARPADDWCDLADFPGPEAEPPEGAAAPLPGGENESEPLASSDAQARALAWKMRLASALEEERLSGGKTWGDRPAFVDDIVRAVLEPPPDWSVLLQHSVSALTRTDRSWLRPSRRMSALAFAEGSWPQVVTMPGHRVTPSGKLVTVIDTSASIGPETLSRFLGVVGSAAAAEGIDELRLMQADAEVTSDEVVSPGELLGREIAIVGRGGTYFAPALLRLAKEARQTGERFSVVYFTDLDGLMPPTREVRVLDVVWVVPGRPRKRPPFGRVIEMNEPV